MHCSVSDLNVVTVRKKHHSPSPCIPRRGVKSKDNRESKPLRPRLFQDHNVSNDRQPQSRQREPDASKILCPVKTHDERNLSLCCGWYDPHMQILKHMIKLAPPCCHVCLCQPWRQASPLTIYDHIYYVCVATWKLSSLHDTLIAYEHWRTRCTWYSFELRVTSKRTKRITKMSNMLNQTGVRCSTLGSTCKPACTSGQCLSAVFVLVGQAGRVSVFIAYCILYLCVVLAIRL